MPRDKNFKRLVRRRMGRTGESYTAARARLVESRRRSASTLQSRGGTAMFPFHRMTEEGRQAFTWANEEAVRRGVEATGSEHLLLALLRDRRSLAAMALSRLGVEADALGREIGQPASSPTRLRDAALPPTGEVKRVIQTAFHAVGTDPARYVGTEHLLVALLADPDGSAARVLAGLGLTAEAVAAEVERLRPSSPERSPEDARPGPPPPAPDLAALIDAARSLAVAEMAPWIRPDDVLRAMAATPGGAAVLAAIGADVSAVASRLEPPAELGALQADARDARARREVAARYQDYERAAGLRDAELSALTEYQRSLNAWLASLNGGA